MVIDEFSPEQQLMILIMGSRGVPDPEDVVRRDRVTAALLGSHLRPVLQGLASATTAALEAYERLVGDR